MRAAKNIYILIYIVIGGGTAGLVVVASRLTEIPDINMIVLEAGPNSVEDPRMNVPGLWTTLLSSEVDWKFELVSQVIQFFCA